MLEYSSYTGLMIFLCCSSWVLLQFKTCKSYIFFYTVLYAFSKMNKLLSLTSYTGYSSIRNYFNTV